ncbi:MAG: hydrolase [Planctomycetes bacterium RBG_16_55_9]|nr:MAG: hydrolase [Planctomycetes bacterium RBG_16_55_9]
MTARLDGAISRQEIQIQTHETTIRGNLCIPREAAAVVIFAHGAGSSRLSPRNQHVAEILQKAGFATLLMDLLSEAEDELDMFTRKLRFDIPLLAGRVDSATEWVRQYSKTSQLLTGCFGASTGAAAALVASARRPEAIGAVVSRGGRPDLADDVLSEVKAPTLLIVGSEDTTVLELNQRSLEKLRSEKELVIVPGATHLFEEPGKLDEVAGHARGWFLKYLTAHRHKKT